MKKLSKALAIILSVLLLLGSVPLDGFGRRGGNSAGKRRRFKRHNGRLHLDA